MDEVCEELDDFGGSSVMDESRSDSSCLVHFLGLPGAPLVLNLHGNDKLRQREHPLLSPEHRSFRVPRYR